MGEQRQDARPQRHEPAPEGLAKFIVLVRSELVGAAGWAYADHGWWIAGVIRCQILVGMSQSAVGKVGNGGASGQRGQLSRAAQYAYLAIVR